METTIFSELNRIQQTLKAPKGQFNKFANFNYRSCEDILEAVKPLLKSCNLILSDEVVNIGDRYYIKATATLTDGKDEVHASAFARETFDKKGMDDAQITGSASSYARKYALNGLFAIDDEKDPDTKDNTKTTPPTTPQAKTNFSVDQRYKCQICGTNDELAHKPNCPNKPVIKNNAVGQSFGTQPK